MSRVTVDSIGDVPYAPELYRAETTLAADEPFGALAERHLEQYRELGFLSFAEILSASECAAVGEALREVVMREDLPPEVELQFEAGAGDVADLTADERLDRVRKFMTFAHVHPAFEAVMRKPEILDAVARLLDAEPEVYQDMALLKPAGLGREKPWHQDKAYFNVEAETPVVGIWIALDEALPENGCMHFLAGSHREGAVPHFNRRDWQLCDTEVLRRGGIVAAPVPAGGGLLFDGLVMHGTPANHSDRRRRALQFHYIPRGASRTSLEARMALFGAEGKNATC